MQTSVQKIIDFNTIKMKQQSAWSAGDYAVVGTTLQIVGENLCEAVDLRAGAKVLDVAAGNGNASLAAARRWCEVVATDYVPALLERVQARAAADHLTIACKEADAEALPFPDNTFDVVLSTFGVMFTPNQEQAAAELVRVCKPGGKIGLANWTPTSLIGEVFKLIGKYVPPAPGVKSPALWGTEVRLRELFAERIAVFEVIPRHFVFRYLSAEHWLDVFKTYYGPIQKTFGALDVDQQNVLTQALIELAERFNRGGDRTLIAPSEYLEVVLTKRDR